jgi:hypothetical protein
MLITIVSSRLNRIMVVMGEFSRILVHKSRIFGGLATDYVDFDR